jgi:translocation and assembly module TamA
MLRRLLAPSAATDRRIFASVLPVACLMLAPCCPAVAQPVDAEGALPSMAAMPDIGLDWPDLQAEEHAGPEETDPPSGEAAVPAGQSPPVPASPPAADALPPALDDPDVADAVILASIDPAAPLRYSAFVEGLEAAANETLLDRFEMLSALREGENARANIAQIRRRGRTDSLLLDELLRGEGYYDSRTALNFRQGGAQDWVGVVLAANPGQLYRLDAIDLDGLDVAGLPDAGPGPSLDGLFALKAGDPAQTDRIVAATAALRAGLLERGYPFSSVGEPVLVIDYERQMARLNLSVETGSFRRIGRIFVAQGAPFGPRHVGVIARFRPGDPFRQSDIVDLDRALVATGLVSQVTIRPEPGASDDLVDLHLSLGQAPLRTIAAELGYGTGEGLRAVASWQHRNFIRPEGALTLRGVLAEQEQRLTATLRRANFGERDRVLNAEISFAHLDQPAYNARTGGISASVERQTNLIFQKSWTWSLGAELLLSRERDLYAFDGNGSPARERERTFVIAALPTSLNFDGSDDLLDPRRGFRIGMRFSPELSLQGGAFSYARAQADGSAYVQANRRVTFAGRIRLGTIIGTARDRIAPTRRFYAGGGASVRGFGYQAIGPRDANNAPLGGRSLGEVSLEARFRFGSLDQFGLVPFLDAGTISSNPWPGIREMRVGAGLGLRYYSTFGPIRIDVGTPINPQPGDSRIGVYVSLGQAF